jgi:hypothetical protein
MCSMSVHCIIRNNKHQLMHQNIYNFVRKSLVHVSTLLGHLQEERQPLCIKIILPEDGTAGSKHLGDFYE